MLTDSGESENHSSRRICRLRQSEWYYRNDSILRVGNLALSRAIGDFDFKRSKELDPKDQIVTCNSANVHLLISSIP